jgi:flagellar assembly protein FliH
MSEQPLITQETFQETPYYDQSWEIVGAPPSEQLFTPMEVAVVGRQDVMLDPMFRDYGGRFQAEAQKRWHLPAELAAMQQSESEAQKEQEVDTRVSIEASEIEQMRAQAHAEGLELGRTQEQARQDEHLAIINERLQAVVQAAQSQIAESLLSMERAAVSLALSISKKIVGHAVEVNPEYIVPIVQEALKSAKGATVQRVRVSPQDFEFFQVVGIGAELKGSDSTWSFEPDPAVQSGCVIDSSAGEIDYQLDKAWERIQDSVVKVIR